MVAMSMATAVTFVGTMVFGFSGAGADPAAADHGGRQWEEAPALLGAVAGVVAHHELADGGEEDDALQDAGGAGVEADAAVQDVAELVRDHRLQLVARQLLERALRH